MDALKNFAYSLVATAPSPATSGTSLVVTAGQGSYFPATPFDATIWPAGSQPSNTNAEIVRVTNVSTDTFTITRAQYGTTAQSIAIGYQIAQTVDANLIGQLAPLTGATFTGAVTSPDFVASGLTGATGGYRWVGSKTTSGAPTSGTFAVGDMMWDITATLWICTIAGTPGTWNPVSSIDLTRRSATATAILGEVTVFNGSTASQTITLPANPVAGTSFAIVNNASVTVNILGGTNSLSIENVTYTATTPYTVPVGAGYGFVFDGTGIWYGTWTTDITNLVGTLAVTNGGTGTTTAPAIGSIPLGSSTTAYTPLAISATAGAVLSSTGTTAQWNASVPTANGGLNTTTSPAVGSIPLGSSTTAYTPLTIGANNTVLRSNGTTATWATDVISFSAGTTGLTPSSATTGAVTLAGTLAVANGGLNATTTAIGSIPVGSSTTAYTPLAIGANGTVLTSNGTTASWATGVSLSGTNTWSGANTFTGGVALNSTVTSTDGSGNLYNQDLQTLMIMGAL